MVPRAGPRERVAMEGHISCSEVVFLLATCTCPLSHEDVCRCHSAITGHFPTPVGLAEVGASVV